MISIKLQKDNASGKQMVASWAYVSKEYVAAHPAVPGERIYVEEANTPASFYKDYSIHCHEDGNLRPIYPEKQGIVAPLTPAEIGTDAEGSTN